MFNIQRSTFNIQDAASFMNNAFTNNLILSVIIILITASSPCAFSQEPDTAQLYYDSAMVHIRAREYRPAVYYLNESVKYDTANTVTVFQLAKACVMAKDTACALKCFARTIELNPSHFLAYKERGNLKARLYDHRGAIEDFTKAINLKQDFSEALFNRGNSEYALKMYREAAADFSKVTALNPKDAEAWYWTGYAKYKLGDKTGGCSALSKAGELGYLKAYEVIKKICN